MSDQKRHASARAGTDSSSRRDFLTSGSKLEQLIRQYDWQSTPLGPLNEWPDALKSSLTFILSSASPMFIWWDKDSLTNFYNDAHIPVIGDKHPSALGKPAKDVWPEIWSETEELCNDVFKSGKPLHKDNLPVTIKRGVRDEEIYVSFSYNPLKDSHGDVVGIYGIVTETTSQVQTLQRLEESEARFGSIADSAPMYIAMADENGKAVYFNKPWLEYTGKTMPEMTGLKWLSTVHPDDAPRFEKDFKHAFARQIPIRKEYRFRRADGTYRWMLAVGAPRITPDGKFIGYFGTYTDFHDLKETQLQLKQSEERFRTLIEKSADAIQLVDEAGKILYSSDSIKNVLGYTPDELANTGVTPYLHPDDADYFFTQFNLLLKNPKKQLLMQYRVKHKDGSWAWIETIAANHLKTPFINALVGNFRNITKQKIAEENMRSSEEQFRALAENIPNLAWMAHADGSIYWYNSRWFEYTGTTMEQMEGWGWETVHDPEYLEKVLYEWKKSITSGKPFEMVFPIKGADGVFRPFLTRIIPLFTEDGTVRQWIGTNTDISEQLRIRDTEARNEELEKITQQLSEQRKALIRLNKSKDEFIGMASHQLRTPATAVKQYMSLVINELSGPLTSEQTHYLAIAYESNERQLGIINDLLKTAQIDSTQYTLIKEKIDLRKVLSEAITEMKPVFLLKDQQCEFESLSSPLTVMVDRSEIKLVLINLLENASKYSKPSTTIKVSVKRSRGYAVIAVRDNGVGIPDDDQARIFEKFTRIDNELSDTVTGTGLGLYWVKQLVELHNGTVELLSSPGKGSTFTIRLPL